MDKELVDRIYKLLDKLGETVRTTQSLANQIDERLREIKESHLLPESILEDKKEENND
jgi:hypothetical protein